MDHVIIYPFTKGDMGGLYINMAVEDVPCISYQVVFQAIPSVPQECGSWVFSLLS